MTYSETFDWPRPEAEDIEEEYIEVADIEEAFADIEEQPFAALDVVVVVVVVAAAAAADWTFVGIVAIAQEREY